MTNAKQKRNVLVTGATAGIGRMIANGFAEAGDTVFVVARTKENCEQTVKEMTAKYPGKCIGIPCDMTKTDSVAALAEQVSAETGGVLHTLVNNAGSVAVAKLDDLTEADWDRVVDINLKGVFFSVQKFAPL